MALLQVRIPSRQCTSLLIEDVFFRRYPELRPIKLSSFKSIEYFCEAADVDPSEAFNMLIRRKTLYSIEWNDFIFIHPDGIIDVIKYKVKAISKKLRITEKVL